MSGRNATLSEPSALAHRLIMAPQAEDKRRQSAFRSLSDPASTARSNAIAQAAIIALGSEFKNFVITP
jgi:hypothetical protein